MTLRHTLAEVTHWSSLAPLVWLAWRTYRSGEPKDVGWWWLAGAFAVSWIADSAAHAGHPLLASIVYPIAQSGLIAGALLLHRATAMWFVVSLIVVAIVALKLQGPDRPDLIFRPFAWGGLVVIAWRVRSLGRLRAALLVYFGLGLVAWIPYTFVVAHDAPCRCVTPGGWATWAAYHLALMAGLVLFCWASTARHADLRVTP